MTLQATLVKDIQKDECISDVNVGVMDMAHDLKEKMRGIEFGRLNQKALWVFRPQDTYAMGFIACGDYMDGGDGRDRYHVFSPNIINNSYTYGDRENMASALHRAKGVKNAAKYLRPWTTKQVMARVQREMYSKADEVQIETRHRAEACAREARGRNLLEVRRYSALEANPLQNELKHLLDSGYEFLDKNLEQNLRATFTANEEYEEIKKQGEAPLTFVEIITVDDTQHFRGYTDVPSTSSLLSVRGLDEDTAFKYTLGDIPEHIMGPISVLSMVGVGQYVAGVGYRAGENMFYVKCE